MGARYSVVLPEEEKFVSHLTYFPAGADSGPGECCFLFFLRLP